MYMALHITNSGVEAKVRTLASATGESMTEAIGRAVEERLRRITPAVPGGESVESILEFVRSHKLQPIQPGLTEDGVLGDGPDGIGE